MKRLLCTVVLGILLLLPQGIRAGKAYGIKDVPNTYAQNRLCHVSDPENILSPESIEEINRMLSLLEDSTGIQSMVVMLQSIGGEDIFEFAHSLFRHWGIGSNERNEGLLVLYVSDQRKIRFTTGYGLEGPMPDAVCKRIQERYMLPHFRKGDTDRGMTEGVAAIVKVLDGSMENIPDEEDPDPWSILLVAIVLSSIIGIMIWLIIRQANTCPKCRKPRALKTIASTSYRDALHRKHIKQTLRCRNCGHTVVRDQITNNNEFNSMAGGAILGGGRSRMGGGGFSGGMFGGGSTGGGGSTSGW